MANDLTLSLGFEVDTNTIQSALQEQLGEFTKGMTSVEESVQALRTMLSDLATPMSVLRDLARDTAAAFADMRSAAQAIKDTVTTTSIQTGGGGGAGGGLGGGGGGGIGGGGGGGSMFGGVLGGLWSGFGSILSPTAFIRNTGGLIGSIATGNWGGALASGAALLPQVAAGGAATSIASHFGLLNDISQLPGMLSESPPDTLSSRGPMYRGIFAPFEALAAGQSPLQMLRTQDPGTLFGAYGFWRGAMRGLGGGPIDLFSQTIGGAVGASRGQDVMYGLAERYFPGILESEGGRAGVRTLGGEYGREIGGGVTSRTIQDAMARYPGYLATMASIATPAIYGADWRALRRLNTTRFGISPEQFGSEFSGLAQGLGARDPDQVGEEERGGEVTSRVATLAMSFSRAYGVGMGPIGQSVGSLLQMGGGGQYLEPSQREESLLRIMTDAVASGFGRRLPEFAQTVASGMQVAFSGPALITNAATPQMAASLAQMQTNVMRSYNVGLVGAQRVMGPYESAPGRVLEALQTGGGDPYAMAAFVSFNRERYGGDLSRMQDELATIQGDPFSATALSLLMPAAVSLGRQSVTTFGQRGSIQRYLTGISGQSAPPEVLNRIINEGIPLYQRIQQEGRDPTQQEWQQIAGLVRPGEGGSVSLEQGRTNIESRGREVMQEQLGALQRVANFSEQQLRISAELSPIAREFYRSQLEETQHIAVMMRGQSMMQMITAVNTMRVSAAEAGARGGVEAYIPAIIEGIRTLSGDSALTDMIESRAGRRQREQFDNPNKPIVNVPDNAVVQAIIQTGRDIGRIAPEDQAEETKPVAPEQIDSQTRSIMNLLSGPAVLPRPPQLHLRMVPAPSGPSAVSMSEKEAALAREQRGREATGQTQQGPWEMPGGSADQAPRGTTEVRDPWDTSVAPRGHRTPVRPFDSSTATPNLQPRTHANGRRGG